MTGCLVSNRLGNNPGPHNLHMAEVESDLHREICKLGVIRSISPSIAFVEVYQGVSFACEFIQACHIQYIYDRFFVGIS